MPSEGPVRTIKLFGQNGQQHAKKTPRQPARPFASSACVGLRLCRDGRFQRFDVRHDVPNLLGLPREPQCAANQRARGILEWALGAAKVVGGARAPVS